MALTKWKRLSTICIIALFLVLLFAGCGGSGDVIPVPENLAIKNGVLTWDDVAGAIGYEVKIDDTVYETDATEFIIQVGDDDDHTVTVRVKTYDGVSAGATMAFFRRNGLDALVDAYNLHTYPWADGPGEKVSAIHRLRNLQQFVSPICSPSGASQGKPCWVTEWGFMNNGTSCPSDERARGLLVQEMMTDFRQLVQQKRLTGLIYYSWVGEARFDVYRCGALTEPGRIASQPF